VLSGLWSLDLLGRNEGRLWLLHSWFHFGAEQVDSAEHGVWRHHGVGHLQGESRDATQFGGKFEDLAGDGVGASDEEGAVVASQGVVVVTGRGGKPALLGPAIS